MTLGVCTFDKFKIFFREIKYRPNGNASEKQPMKDKNNHQKKKNWIKYHLFIINDTTHQ
jgi:hypothetical protein